MMKIDACRSERCRASIVWTLTRTGKRMPVDAEPIVTSRGFRLNANAEPPLATFAADPAPGELLFVSHYATCPDAGRFRS